MADPELDTDSEDEMPPGWEERVTIEGKVFYACHETQKTQWTHPITGKRKKITGELPYGWERKIGDSGYVYYVDHMSQKTTFTDPRLAFAVEDKDIVGDISSLRQKFDSHSTAMQVLVGRDLSGKFCIITGANSGIGFETARSLALHGCHVILACRNVELANQARDTIIAERSQAQVTVMTLDLSSLASVRSFAQEYKKLGWPLHMLILNAGVFSPPHTITEDNLELSFQVNFLSHFYMCRLFERILKRSAPSRIVHVASESHRYRSFSVQSVDDVTLEKLSPSKEVYGGLTHYGVTKLLNVAISNAINQRLVVHKVFSNSVHPGNMINTSLQRNWWGYRLLFKLAQPFTKTLQQGAATTVFVATSKDLEDVGGMYFNNCWVCDPSDLANNSQFSEKLYELAHRLLIAKMGQTAYDM